MHVVCLLRGRLFMGCNCYKTLFFSWGNCYKAKASEWCESIWKLAPQGRTSGFQGEEPSANNHLPQTSPFLTMQNLPHLQLGPGVAGLPESLEDRNCCFLGFHLCHTDGHLVLFLRLWLTTHSWVWLHTGPHSSPTQPLLAFPPPN